MKLIPEWRSALRLFSVQANIIGVALASTYASMYGQLKADLPPQQMAAITACVFAAGILLRIISQQPKEDNAPADR